MADTIKFRCKNCEKKIAVRADYAGKKARCPGCKQPLRVPSPRPKRSSTGVPVAVGASPGDSSAGAASSISLEALAQMEANADAPLKELSSRGFSQPDHFRVEDGKDCPSCNSSLKQDAVICVYCGHDFDSGKQLKTKQSKEKVAKVKAPMTLKQKAIVGLVIVAVLAIAGVLTWVALSG